MGKNNKNGFSLIEITIVLVTIGLIITGVLVAQDMVKAAKARATIAQIEKYNTATLNFVNKFSGYLPGDFPWATRMLGATGGADENGDGDGCIDDNNTINCTPLSTSSFRQDMPNFWLHLGLAKLIKGKFVGTTVSLDMGNIGKGFPKLELGTGGLIAYSRSGVNYWKTVANDFNGNAVDTSPPDETFDPMMTPNDARGMDTKIDDGIANTGKVQVQNDWSGVYIGTDCFDTTSGLYLLINDDNTCSLEIEMATR